MLSQLKDLVKKTATKLQYRSTVQGWGSIIRGSSVNRQAVCIHKNVLIKNSRIDAFVDVSNSSTLENVELLGHNRIGRSCGIANSSIGRYTYVGDLAGINNTSIGNFCSIGPSFMVGGGTHPTNFISTSPAFYRPDNILSISTDVRLTFEEYKNTTIGNDVWIGANVFCSEGITIGNGSVIAAGAVVTKDVPAFAVVGGVPAKVIRYRYDEQTIALLNQLGWWNKSAGWLKNNLQFFNQPLQHQFLTNLLEN